jgi:hypothetical protein
MSLEKVTLERFKHQDKQTLGILYLKDDVTLKTLELDWQNNEKQQSCIPIGTYKVVPRTSKKYGKHFHVTNVENRDMILFHSGNYHTHILGCILVGLKHSDVNKDGYLDVTQSKDAMKVLLDTYPNGFELQIINC